MVSKFEAFLAHHVFHIFRWFQTSDKQDRIVHPAVTYFLRLHQRIAMDEFCIVSEGDSYFFIPTLRL